jgi:hypothetical protein
MSPDIAAALNDVRFRGVKRTSLFDRFMSAFDPKRTLELKVVALQNHRRTPFRRAQIPDVIAL